MFLPSTPHRPVGSAWFLGLDLGQRRDYSALATLSIEWTVLPPDPATWERARVPRLILRDIERFPLGTSYTSYGDALESRVNHLNALTPAHTACDVTLVVDAGGPGAPVVDELRRARLDLTLRPLIVTGGMEANTTHGGYSTVPRKMLLTNLILLLDHGKLVAPRQLENWEILLEELLELNAATTHPTRTTAHDDMVMALAIAVWQAARQHAELLPERKKSRAHWSPILPFF